MFEGDGRYPFERHGVFHHSMVPQFFLLQQLGGIILAADLSGLIITYFAKKQHCFVKLM